MNWYCYRWYPHKSQLIADLKMKKSLKSDSFCRSLWKIPADIGTPCSTVFEEHLSELRFHRDRIITFLIWHHSIAIRLYYITNKIKIWKKVWSFWGISLRQHQPYILDNFHFGATTVKRNRGCVVIFILPVV